MAKAASFRPKGFHTLTPHLQCDDAAAAIDWYKKALGAEEVGRSLDPNGKVMHSELRFGDSPMYLNDVMHGKGPRELGGSPAAFWLYVENSDAAFKRAVDAGAKVQMPLEDQFWGDRGGAVLDPAGYVWWIATRKEDLTKQEVEKRAEEFFATQPQPVE